MTRRPRNPRVLSRSPCHPFDVPGLSGAESPQLNGLAELAGRQDRTHDCTTREPLLFLSVATAFGFDDSAATNRFVFDALPIWRTEDLTALAELPACRGDA